MLTPTEADKFNRAAEFFPQTHDDNRPGIQVAGILVFAYIDDSGVVRVSVHLDTTENSVLDARGLVPLRIVVEDTTVYDGEQDAEQTLHNGLPATPAEIVSDHPASDVEDRKIELRVDDTLLARLAHEHHAEDDWPDTNQQWRKQWLDTVTTLINRAHGYDGLLTMSTPAGWRRPAIEIVYDMIADACSGPDGIALHLRTVDTGSEICTRRYFSVEDMQFLTVDGRVADTPDIEAVVRGLVCDLEMEINNLYREFVG
ncbi:hypothetical protein [Nocardia asiatica]|uniref:hypothetical protein n=1 Tax=Nocardia asiatica TaxID=209252 RepID=UPI000318B080|nr:hypothetical protein [Nocardia asiatica]